MDDIYYDDSEDMTVKEWQILEAILSGIPSRSEIRGSFNDTLYEILINEDNPLIKENIKFRKAGFSNSINKFYEICRLFGVMSKVRPAYEVINTERYFSRKPPINFSKADFEYLQELGKRLVEEYGADDDPFDILNQL